MTNLPPPGYQPYNTGAAGPKPNNYLVWAILSTLFCCWPFGIASIVFAAKVDGQYNKGDYAGALESSAKAKKFAIWSVVGYFVFLIGVVLFVVIARAGSSS